MRPILAALAAAPAFVFAPIAYGGTLPSLTVPTFSMAFRSYATDLAPSPAAVQLVSTGATSTVIGLSSIASDFQDQAYTYGAMPMSIFSTIGFQAAAGYRITGIEFSAVAVGSWEPPTLSDGEIIVSPGSGGGLFSGGAGIVVPDATPETWHDYQLGGTEQGEVFAVSLRNTADLRSFDYRMYHYLLVTASPVIYTYPNPGADDYITYGLAKARLLNPTLTIYTAALPVPEPGSWAMLAAGLGLIVGMRRSRRS